MNKVILSPCVVNDEKSDDAIDSLYFALATLGTTHY
jgi:hypothetical protein